MRVAGFFFGFIEFPIELISVRGFALAKLRLDVGELDGLKAHIESSQVAIDILGIKALRVLRQGGVVVIEQRFRNARTQEICYITSAADFKSFWVEYFTQSN